MSKGVIERYRQFLPVTEKTPIITLGEGNTPLILADRLAKEIGFNGQLYLKFEGANPTGSFKDRGMTVAVSKALEDGAEMLVCASTGNTASSAAAYGAKTELPIAVVVPKGGVAAGKLAQINMYGAKLVEINGSFDACQSIVKALVKKYPKTALLNSINPYRLEGQKTAAFEIWEELGRAPDYHFIPVGNAGNITAYWIGYREYKSYTRQKYIDIATSSHPSPLGFEQAAQSVDIMLSRCNPHPLKVPKMMGYQAEGAAPIVRGYIIENPQTIASAIKIGNPARWQDALKAVSESGGKFDTVYDEEILCFHALIPKLCPEASCEPASAACVAGLAKAVRLGEIENKENTVVACTLTGAFWKDLDAFKKGKNRRTQKTIDADLSAVEKFLKL